MGRSAQNNIGRTCLAALGGYGLAALFTLSFCSLPVAELGHWVLAVTLMSFVVAAVVIIWCFIASTLRRAVAGVLLAAGLCSAVWGVANALS